jgi:hypothetical protein
MKKHSKALLLSAFIFPGAGQLYLQQKIKGSILLIITGIALWLLFPPVYEIAEKISSAIMAGTYTEDMLTQEMAIFKEPYFLTLKGLIFICWIISCIDAWISGKRLNLTNNR